MGPGLCKKELEKSLKWTNSPKLLTNLISQDNNSRIRLGYEKIESSYNARRKKFPNVDNILCVNCGRDRHLKKDYSMLKNMKKVRQTILNSEID